MNLDRRIVIELEARLIRRGDTDLATLIDDDFVEFGRSGKIWRRSDVVDVLAAPVLEEIRMEDVKLRSLAENVTLCTYQSVSPRGRSLRSSVWICRDGDWRLVFHQGTAASSGTGGST